MGKWFFCFHLQRCSTNKSQNGSILKQLDPVAWDNTRHFSVNVLTFIVDYLSTNIHSFQQTPMEEYGLPPRWCWTWLFDLPWSYGEKNMLFCFSLWLMGFWHKQGLGLMCSWPSLWKEHAWGVFAPKRHILLESDLQIGTKPGHAYSRSTSANWQMCKQELNALLFHTTGFWDENFIVWMFDCLDSPRFIKNAFKTCELPLELDSTTYSTILLHNNYHNYYVITVCIRTTWFPKYFDTLLI